jgi:hypothetical protein
MSNRWDVLRESWDALREPWRALRATRETIRAIARDRRTTAEIGFIGAVLATLFVVQLGLYGLGPTLIAGSHASTGQATAALTKTEAIAAARAFVSPEDRFVSAAAGPFPFVNPSARMVQDRAVSADERVWAVSFESPGGGWETVILDLFSAEWITTISFEGVRT